MQDAMVVFVGQPDPIAVEGQVLRLPQTERGAAGHEVIHLHIEHLHAVISGIDDVNPAVTVDVDVVRPRKLASSAAVCADRALELASERQKIAEQQQATSSAPPQRRWHTDPCVTNTTQPQVSLRRTHLGKLLLEAQPRLRTSS